MGPTPLHPSLHSPHLEKGCIGQEGTGLVCLPIPKELFTPHLPALPVSDGLRPGLSQVLWLLGQPQQGPDAVKLGKGHEPFMFSSYLPGKAVPILSPLPYLDFTLGLLARQAKTTRKNQRWNKPCLFTSVSLHGANHYLWSGPFPPH